MSRIESYETLREAVSRYVVFDDVAEQFDSFLRLAEDRLNCDLRVPEMIETFAGVIPTGVKTLSLTASSEFYAGAGKPTQDLIEVIYICCPERGSLQMINIERLLRLDSYWSSTTGNPEVYAIADEMYLAPNPAGKNIKVGYFREVPPLTPDSPTNAIVERYGGVYLYACLLEAAAFMDDSPKEESFLAMYGRNLDAANAGAMRRELNPSLDQSAKRSVNLPPGSELPGQLGARAATARSV